MRVGLLTYHFSDNYGALMQAYALRKWLIDRGLCADFINYQPTYVEEGGRLDRPWLPTLWRKNATILYMKLTHLQRRFLGSKQQKASFNAFRNEHLGISGPRMLDVSDLTPEMANYDLLICGSDQIWNPSIQRGLDPVYFLEIPGSDHARKVAYAPSFGRAKIEPEHILRLRQLVSGLHGISVREATGREILENCGVPRNEVQVVPDPTVLLGRFDSLLDGNPPPDNSVFCYALRTDEIVREVANETARLTGGPLLGPRSTHQRWRDIGQGFTPGPVEWLRNLARARVVVSNSFHGVALSIVLNRPFIAVSLPGKRAKMNARVENLLKIADLAERLVNNSDPSRVRALVERPIDWGKTNCLLSAVRAEAEAYLNAHIAKAQGFST